MNVYMHKWFDVETNNTDTRAQVVDIEFETGSEPIFLMETKSGSEFWVTRSELREYDTQS